MGGVGAADHRGPVALVRSSDRILGAMGSHWRGVMQRHNIIWFVFLKDSSGCCVDNGLYREYMWRPLQ